MKIIICILFLARQDSFEQNEVNGLSGTLMYRMLSGLNGLSGTTMYDAFRFERFVGTNVLMLCGE